MRYISLLLSAFAALFAVGSWAAGPEAFQAAEMIINRNDNIAIVVLTVCLFSFAWMVMKFRKEDREDRKELREAVDRNTSALYELRLVVASLNDRSNNWGNR
jgi:hypothetical protein